MITDLLVQHAKATPGAPFLFTDQQSYSFSETLHAVKTYASLLKDHGVRRGDHVALLADNGAPFVVAMLAAVWLGAVVVALNNELVAEGLLYSIRQSDSKFIIADSRWLKEKRHYLDGSNSPPAPLLNLLEERELFQRQQEEPAIQEDRVPGSSACTILYTSGTTGLPKGVVNSHDCYRAVGCDTAKTLKLTTEDRIMVFLPMFHANPQMYALMSALTVGCSLILRARFSAANFFEDARRFKATGFTFVGTVMSILAMRHPGEVTDHKLRFGFGGGVPLKVWEDMRTRFGFRIYEVYGMTEIGGWVASNTDEHYRVGSCGRIRESMDVRIFDGNDVELPAKAIGEIVVRPKSPNLILTGYYRKPELLVECSSNFWFHTGDRGSIDADGYLYFHGRSKELIRRAGEMISPVEIETHVRTMKGVLDCAAVAVEDAVMGEEIKIAVVVESPVNPKDILEHLGGRIPRYMLPRYVEFLDQIPKTETEKIQRHKLQYVSSAMYDSKASS